MTAKNALQGQDKIGGDLRDVSHGTNQGAQFEETRTAGLTAQAGADVRGPISGQTVHELPEGLKRDRKGPLDKHEGRGEVPSQVPSHNPKGGKR